MKFNRITVSLLSAGMLASPLAQATNGDTMMAVGSQSTAMGGTGVAHFVGAESTFANPAMLAKTKGRELTGGIVLFKPNVTNDGMSGAASSSSANTNYIPDVSYSSRISDSLSYGVAMAGIAGMGVNYTGANPATHVLAKTTLSILKVVPTIAYNADNYGVGFSPVLQYGSLAISYNNGTAVNAAHNANTDTNFGYNLGGYYNISPTVTAAAAYFSPIKMTYGTQLSAAGTGFGQTFADQLEQPAEIKFGVSLLASDSFTVTADYRQIQWAKAGGYKAFGWKNQNVVAIGGKYAANGYWLGMGYNSANNPISEYANGVLTPYGNNGGIVNMFNNLMFPAVIKNSYTLGAGYSLKTNLDIEGSIVYSPKVTTRVDISDAFALAPGSRFNTTTHSQQSYSVSLRYRF
ncbi:MAG: outer membrane protein transport protein [Nitrosomonadales bacterium]|nr:outer membrane protein transport protein [Nitrosomonadales bacterium]